MNPSQNHKLNKSNLFIKLSNLILCIVGTLIFLMLLYYTLRFTQYIQPGTPEVPIDTPDSLIKNLITIAAVLVIMHLLMLWEQKLSDKMKLLIGRSFLAATCLWLLLSGLFWITSSDRMLEGDQAAIFNAATAFSEGNYEALGLDGYCRIYPQQLAIILLIEYFYLLVGVHNLFAFEVLCVLLATGVVYIGYKLLKELDSSMTVSCMYCILMCFCLPLILYTPWLYGEIPSIFFCLLAAWRAVRYSNNSKWYELIGIIAALMMAILFRKNTLIVLIAFAIAGVIYGIMRKDSKILISVLLAALLPSLIYTGIYKLYEVRSGYGHLDGMPTSTWISMGMRDAYDGKCGWYSDYALELMEVQDYDTNAVDMVAKQDIADRLAYFAENPGEAFAFYKSKMLSQWNQPLYQSMYFTTKYPSHLVPASDTLTYKLFNESFGVVLGIANSVQTIIYFGVLCYYLLVIRKEDNILKHILIIAIIGGFLFSILWEAKARYIFPYYMFMFPYAVLGLKECLLFGKRHIIIRNVSKTDNRGCSNAGEESPGFIGQDAR